MNKKKKFMIKFFVVVILIILIAELYFIHYMIIKKELGIDGNEALKAAFDDFIKQPFAIFPIPSTALFFIVAADFLIPLFIYMEYQNAKARRHYDPDKVQGDSKWLEGEFLDDYNKKFSEPFDVSDHSGKNNMILSKEMFMSMDNKGIAIRNNFNSRNSNVLAIGGSGAGKTFGLVGPNIMQANCSFIITDPSGELFANYSSFLEDQGYKVKCFNLDNMKASNRYNPFNYIEDDKDVEILVNTLITNTTPPKEAGGDPFWVKSEICLLCAVVAYLLHYADIAPRPLIRSFSTVTTLVRMGAVNEANGDDFENDLDLLFKDIEEKDPRSFAVKQYRSFKMGAGKTLKSVLMSVLVRLQAFDLEPIMDLTDTDDLDLKSIGDEKTAMFVIIPTGDTTFNFLAAMMYSQLFQEFYRYCENEAYYSQCVYDGNGELVKTFRAKNQQESDKIAAEKAKKFLEKTHDATVKFDEEMNLNLIMAADGSCLGYRSSKEEAEKALSDMRNGEVRQNKVRALPIHTRFLLDEFYNTGKIPNFVEKVATVRKYEISVTIILQSLQMLKNLYKDDWESISGNCDNMIYLGGGADLTTTEWVSKLIGEETRVVMNQSFKAGSMDMSLSRVGKELYSSAQLRTMPENECIVLQKSLFAYIGEKFNATMHKNWKYCDGSRVYIFNADRYKTLRKMTREAGEKGSEAAVLGISGHGVAIDKEVSNEDLNKAFKEKEKIRETKNKKNEVKAYEAKANMDADGKPKITEPEEIKKEDLPDKINVKTEEDIKETMSSIIEDNEDLDFDTCDFISVKAGR